jgi:hypothetical protein
MVLMRRTRDEGAVAVIVAVVCTVIFSLAAIVIDLGLARDQRRQAQNTADSAALAAAQYLSQLDDPSQVTDAELNQAFAIADRFVAANDWPEGISLYEFKADTSTVRIGLRPRDTPTLFAGFVQAAPPAVSATATASWANTALRCAVCILRDVRLQNGNIAVIDGGSVAIGGNLVSNSQGSIIVAAPGATGVVGTAPPPQGQGYFVPTIRKIPAFEDPYASLTLPPPGADFSVAAATPGNNAACPPGNYVDLENCATLAPGLYVLTGDAKLTGNQTLVANGVVLYFACSERRGGATFPRACAAGGENGATFGGAGKGSVTINAPTAGTYAGYPAVLFDRNNTTDFRYVGNGSLTVNGVVYGARATVDMRGNGSGKINGALVAGFAKWSGNNPSIYVQATDLTPLLATPVRARLTE